MRIKSLFLIPLFLSLFTFSFQLVASGFDCSATHYKNKDGVYRNWSSDFSFEDHNRPLSFTFNTVVPDLVIHAGHHSAGKLEFILGTSTEEGSDHLAFVVTEVNSAVDFQYNLKYFDPELYSDGEHFLRLECNPRR